MENVAYFKRNLTGTIEYTDTNNNPLSFEAFVKLKKDPKGEIGQL